MPKATRKIKPPRPLVENAADPRQVRRGKIEEDDRRQQELADLKSIASLRPGRRVLHRLITETGLFDISFRGGQPDVTAFHEGQRAIGKLIRDELMAVDPLLVGMMDAEHAEDQASEQALRESAAIDREREAPTEPIDDESNETI